MADVDDRIVSMSFDNSKFESGVAKTTSTLGKLKEALSLKGAKDGLSNIESTASKFSLGNMIDKVGQATHAFGLLRTAGLIAFADIVRRATNAGLHMAAAFTVDPIKEGFKSYETQINAVQTILANTGLKGKKGMDQVNAALKELQVYANKTVYNFADMAHNIGTFTAAGVGLKTSVESIKGIANLAALSGSNSQQASTAMYQLSQAIAAGQVHLQDWNSVVNAGIGGKVFQKSLLSTAQAMGTLSKNAVKTSGPMKTLSVNGLAFRNSLTPKPGQKSWLTSDVLTTALSNFTGDISKAKLASEGFSKAQITAIEAQGKMANNAATKIKTLSQLTQALKEEVATAYGQVFKTIFGSIGQAKALFSPLHQTLENALTGPIYDFNKLLAGAVKLGARGDVIQGVKNIFAGLSSVLKPVKEAFRDIFPAETAQELANLAKEFENFTAGLKIGSTTANELKRTFQGVFSIFDIGRQVIEGVFHVLGSLLGSVTKTSGGFLAITANIGDFLTGLDKAIKNGKGLTDFFDGLAQVVKVPAQVLGALPALIGGIFKGFNLGGASKIEGAFTGIGSKAEDFEKKISDIGDKIGTFFSNLGQTIGQALSSVDWSSSLAAVNTGLLGGILLLVKKFLDKGFKVEIAKGLFGSVSEAFETLTGSLKAMQTSIQASTLEKIAISVGILTASIVALSTVNGAKLKTSLKALAVAFAELLGAMKILTNVTQTAGFVKMPIIASSLILLAGAIDTLTIAVVVMSKLDWNQLTKGLVGVAALLGGLTAVAGPLGKSSAGLIRAGVGISAIAVGLNIMALAVKQLGGLDLATEAKGIGGVAAVLVAVGGASKLFPKNMVAIGAGVIAIAAGMKIMAGAVNEFGSMNLVTLGKGIAGVAVSIAAVAGGMRLMPAGMAMQAAGLALVAVSIGKLVDAVSDLGGLSITVLAKGLISLGGAIAILAVGLDAMTGSAMGAAALAVAAASVDALVPGLKALGSMDILSIVKALAALAATLAIVGAAGVLLDGASLGILALGAAIALAGAGFAAFGAGVDLIAHGFAILQTVSSAAVAVMIKAIEGLATTIPQVAVEVGKGVVNLVTTIAKAGPVLVTSMGKIIGDILQAITNDAPKFATAMTAVIQALIRIIRNNAGPILKEGINLLESLLKGIKQNIGQITTEGLNIVTKFLNTIADKAGKLIDAGTNVIISFVKGISSSYGKIVNAGAQGIESVLTGLGKNAGKILAAGATAIGHFVSGIASGIGDVAAKAANAVARLITGLASDAGKIVSAGVTAITHFVTGIASAAVKIAAAAGKAVLNFVTGLTAAINRYEPQIVAASIALGAAIPEGMAKGIASEAGAVVSAAEHVASSIPSKIGHLLHINSPSKVTEEQGRWVVAGLAQGIRNSKDALNASSDMANGLINNVKDIFGIQSPSKVMKELGQFVGTGFSQGLRGSQDDVTNAFNDMADKINSAITDASKKISTARADLSGASKKEKKSLHDTINENKKTLKQLDDVRNEFSKGLDKDKTNLLKMAANYDKLSDKIKDAQDNLTSAKQTMADAITQYDQELDTLPSISDILSNSADDGSDPLTDYETQLNQALANLNTYSSVLAQLRQAGLNNQLYAQLVSDGPADLAFAQELLANVKAGGGALTQLNQQSTALANSASSLATTAGTALNQAGVDAAQQLLNGLQLKQKDLKTKMNGVANDITTALDKVLGIKIKKTAKDSGKKANDIGSNMVAGVAEGINNHTGAAYNAVSDLADGMINTLKKKLKIKSPSQVFAELGGYSASGFAQGLANSQTVVSNAATDVGDTAVQAMQDSLSKASAVVMSKIDPNPTITPVLDLSTVTDQAKTLNKTQLSIAAVASTDQANAIAASKVNTGKTDESDATPKVISFTQNNNSPKALSPIEIYRQTNNQLSQAKKLINAK